MSTRQKLLAEAAKVHAARGEDAISMRAIAANVGVTATSIYRHFHDKSELVEALADRGFEILLETLQRKRSTASPVQRVMLNFLDFAFEQPRLYELMFLGRRARTRVFPGDFAAHRSPTFDLLRDAVEKEIGKLDGFENTLSIWAHAHGLISMFTLGRFGDDAGMFRRIYSSALRRHYTALRRK